MNQIELDKVNARKFELLWKQYRQNDILQPDELDELVELDKLQEMSFDNKKKDSDLIPS